MDKRKTMLSTTFFKELFKKSFYLIYQKTNIKKTQSNWHTLTCRNLRTRYQG